MKRSFSIFTRRAARFAWILLGVELLDELSAGVPMLGAPEIRGAFEVDYSAAAFMLLVAPEVVSWILEPPLFMLSDKLGKRRLVLLGMVGLAVSLGLAAVAPNAYVFAAAMILFFPASGLGVALSQAALMDAYPRRRAALMARWTLLGTVGDVLAPVLLSTVVLLGGSWRTLLACLAGAFLIQAIATARMRWREAPPSQDEDEPTWRDLLRAGFTNRGLWLWSAAVALTGLLDEVFVAFAALFLRDAAGASRLETDAALLAYSLGGMLGLAITERLSKRLSARRLLVLSGLAAAAVFVTWLAVPGPLTSAGLLFVLGIVVTPHYPLAQAEAYAHSPGRAGTVAAVGQLLAPVRLVFPLAVGFAADRVGLSWALLLLLAQPLGVVAISALDRDGDRRSAA